LNAKSETGASAFDTVKLSLAVALLLGGIVGYYVFDEQSVLLRAAGVIVGVALALVVAMQSSQGRELWRFIQNSRVELRKVVWPTRNEVRNTTFAVIVFVVIMGVFFWILDFFLLKVTQMLTGRGV
jgi:preprotein translocase subunit SecE